MFPRCEFDLPILGLDLVARGDKVPYPAMSPTTLHCHLLPDERDFPNDAMLCFIASLLRWAPSAC